MPNARLLSLLAILAALLAAGSANADWPTYQGDNLRSAVATDALTTPLRLAWTFRSPAPPRPAWTGHARWDAWITIHTKPMRNFDPVFYVTAADGAVYFGSSVDDAVHCLDASTGEQRWVFPTDGAVRLPPTIDAGRAYFGSDDGWAYCIDARDGSLVWKYRLAADERLIASDGKVLSSWPCRTGVLVADGKAYCSASLLPWEQSFLCALDAATGSDSGPGLYRAVHTGVTMQGAMLSSPEHLYVPQGRSAPLVFSRATGKSLGTAGAGGGVYAVLTDDRQLIHGPGNKTGWLSLGRAEGFDRVVTVGAADRIVIAGPMAYMHQGAELAALDRASYLAAQNERAALGARKAALEENLRELGSGASPEQKTRLANDIRSLQVAIAKAESDIAASLRWRADCPLALSMVLAGDLLIVGGDDQVAAHRASDGRRVWRAEVNGRAHGLAVATGNLFVSTDEGAIHCFAAR